MTTQKLFKRRVRARMSKTGESYTAARRQVAAKRDSQPAPHPDVAAPDPGLASAMELASDGKVVEATGRGWLEWLAVLDQWGARKRKHSDTAEYLVNEHGVPGWYAQAITNGYERARGMRAKHQQSDGFTVYASKTFGVPKEALYAAFVDDRKRSLWLTDGTMSLRSSQTGKVARFQWSDGRTRVTVNFEEKGPTKSTAAVSHERLPDPDAAEAAKAAWKNRLTRLKSSLESNASPD